MSEFGPILPPLVNYETAKEKVLQAIELAKAVKSGFVYVVARNDKLEVNYHDNPDMNFADDTRIIWMGNAQVPVSLQWGTMSRDFVAMNLRHYSVEFEGRIEQLNVTAGMEAIA